MGKTNIAEVSIIRTLAVILVVFIQHSFGPYSNAWNFVPEIPNNILIGYGIMATIFNNISMPLLIFISGYLYARLYIENGKYHSYSKLVCNKIHRLLIPAYIFGVIFSLTLTPEFLTFSNLSEIVNGYAHLWYLPALFWCFVFAPLFIERKKWIIEVILLLITFVFIYVPFPRILGLGFHMYFFYFVLGINIVKYQNILRYFDKDINRVLLLFITIICLIILCIYDGNDYTDNPLLLFPFNEKIVAIIRNIYRLTAIVSILILTIQIANKFNIVNNNFFRFLDKTSFGVYIFHMWIMWLLFKNNSTSEYVIPFARDHYITFPFIYFFVAFILSTIITAIFKRIKLVSSIL